MPLAQGSMGRATGRDARAPGGAPGAGVVGRWRVASLASTALLAVAFAAVMWGRALLGRAALEGTDLGGRAAPDFHLPNDQGQVFSLASWAGKPVVLTFLYTQCPDACPLIAEKLKLARQSLGADAERVGFVAISGDGRGNAPDGDSPERIREFTRIHGLEGAWQYLTAAPTDLDPVWRAYYVAPLRAWAGGGPHTSPIYLLDKQHRQRVLLGPDATATTIARDLRALLRE